MGIVRYRRCRHQWEQTLHDPRVRRAISLRSTRKLRRDSLLARGAGVLRHWRPKPGLPARICSLRAVTVASRASRGTVCVINPARSTRSALGSWVVRADHAFHPVVHAYPGNQPSAHEATACRGDGDVPGPQHGRLPHGEMMWSGPWNLALMVAIASQSIEDARHGGSRPGPRLECPCHAIAIIDDVFKKFLAEI